MAQRKHEKETINPFKVANAPNLPLSERIHAQRTTYLTVHKVHAIWRHDSPPFAHQFHNTWMCNSTTFAIERFFRICRMLLVMDLIICAVQVAQCSLKMVNRLKKIGIVYQL